MSRILHSPGESRWTAVVVDLLLGMLLCVLILAFDRARDGGDAMGPAMTRIAAPDSEQSSAVSPPS